MTIKIYCKDKSYVINDVITYTNDIVTGMSIMNIVQQNTTTIVYLDKVRLVRIISGTGPDNIRVESKQTDRNVEQKDTELPLRSDVEVTRLFREIFGN